MRDARGRFTSGGVAIEQRPALERFRQFCRFDPETGCVLWTGGQTRGRGHNVPYGAFWFEGRRWFAHRWAAKYIHGHDTDGYQVDHCCPDRVPFLHHPNTLCVEHVRPLTPEKNRWLQTERRRHFVHLQVGLISYEDAYGPPDEAPETIPFYIEPKWLSPDAYFPAP